LLDRTNEPSTFFLAVGGAGCDEMDYAPDNPTGGMHVGMITISIVSLAHAHQCLWLPPHCQLVYAGTTCDEWADRVEKKASKYLKLFSNPSYIEAFALHSPFQSSGEAPFGSKNARKFCDTAEFFTDAYALGKMTIEDNGRGDLTWELYSSIDGSVLDKIVLSK
jgi:hypothetical protein